jgi:hypothetical protein
MSNGALNAFKMQQKLAKTNEPAKTRTNELTDQLNTTIFGDFKNN